VLRLGCIRLEIGTARTTGHPRVRLHSSQASGASCSITSIWSIPMSFLPRGAVATVLASRQRLAAVVLVGAVLLLVLSLVGSVSAEGSAAANRPHKFDLLQAAINGNSSAIDSSTGTNEPAPQCVNSAGWGLSAGICRGMNGICCTVSATGRPFSPPTDAICYRGYCWTGIVRNPL